MSKLPYSLCDLNSRFLLNYCRPFVKEHFRLLGTFWWGDNITQTLEDTCHIWQLGPSHSISLHENYVLGGFYFCSHFLSSGRNILKFDMKKIQQIRRIWFKTGEIWNTKVICYFSAQTQLVNQNETSYFRSQNNHISMKFQTSSIM